MKYLFLILSLLLLISCQTAQLEEIEQPLNKRVTGLNPLWLYELPVGSDYIIGISQCNHDTLTVENAAREMASVMKSRNTGSYTIQKFSQTDAENIQKSGNASFNLNVGTPEEAKENFKKLHIIDSHKLNHYFIGLYSIATSEIEDKYKKKEIRSFPKWYQENKIEDNSGYLTTWASDGSYDLITAWEKAAEVARYQIADYLEKDVSAGLFSNNEDITKKISIETTRKLANLEITRSYIVTEKYDTLYSYKIYLEMKMRKRL